MDKLTKSNIYWSIFMLIVGILIIIAILSNPLRRSEEKIRAMVLKEIPVGTKIDDAIEIINNTRWKIDRISEGYGYEKNINETQVYNKQMTVHLGSYRNVFVTDVVVFLRFSEKGDLIDVTVRKDVDGL